MKLDIFTSKSCSDSKQMYKKVFVLLVNPLLFDVFVSLPFDNGSKWPSPVLLIGQIE